MQWHNEGADRPGRQLEGETKWGRVITANHGDIGQNGDNGAFGISRLFGAAKLQSAPDADITHATPIGQVNAGAAAMITTIIYCPSTPRKTRKPGYRKDDLAMRPFYVGLCVP